MNVSVRQKGWPALFLNCSCESPEPMPVLEAMLETGLLTAYIPEFSSVESLAQHDLYHIYTVDRHQLETVGEMASAAAELRRNCSWDCRHRICFIWRPCCMMSARGARRIIPSWVLKLCGPLPDVWVWKTRSRNVWLFWSAIIFFCRKMPCGGTSRISSSSGKVRRLVGDIDRLTMLYLLTIADSKATGPSAWSSWKASLLADFYLQDQGLSRGSLHR